MILQTQSASHGSAPSPIPVRNRSISGTSPPMKVFQSEIDQISENHVWTYRLALARIPNAPTQWPFPGNCPRQLSRKRFVRSPASSTGVHGWKSLETMRNNKWPQENCRNVDEVDPRKMVAAKSSLSPAPRPASVGRSQLSVLRGACGVGCGRGASRESAACSFPGTGQNTNRPRLSIVRKWLPSGVN